jgi:hypothetical protein
VFDRDPCRNFICEDEYKIPSYKISAVGRFELRKWQRVAINSLYLLHDYLEMRNEQFF